MTKLLGPRRHETDAAQRERIHVATSRDGTKIAGRVRGQGPPLVLVHGGLGDGETSWPFMLPFLVDRFTCYLMSTRGRGLSGDNVDHSRERQSEDIAAFVEGIGDRVGVFGHSSGAFWVLGGAALAAEHVGRVALYEPPLPLTGPFTTEEQKARIGAAMSDGRPADAVRLAVEAIGLDDDERVIFTSPLALEIATPHARVAYDESRELDRPIDDDVLDRLTMPVLLIQGSVTRAHFKDAVRHLDRRLRAATVVEIPSAGHMGPLTAGEAVAREIVRFFDD